MSGFHEGELAVQQLAGVRAEADRLGACSRRPTSAAAASVPRRAHVRRAHRARRRGAAVDLAAGRPARLPRRRGHDAAGPRPAVARRSAARPPRGTGGRPDRDGLRPQAPDPRQRHARRARTPRACASTSSRRSATAPSTSSRGIWRRTPRRPSTPRPRAAPRCRRRSGRCSPGTETFFLGTTHPDRGVDTSHRGGPAGFVRVEDGALWWPDYPGNNMFNSFGNLAVDDTAARARPRLRHRHEPAALRPRRRRVGDPGLCGRRRRHRPPRPLHRGAGGSAARCPSARSRHRPRGAAA